MNDITQETVNLTKQLEGERLKAYKDSVGRWTIGSGHTKGVYEGMQITEQTSRQFLIDDLAIAATCVNRVIKKPMSDHEFGAFVSLTLNIGVGAFSKSTAARRFNKGDKNGAAKAILMWNKITIDGKKVVSQGLINRREAEVRYFEMNVSDAAFPTHFYETTAGEGGAHKKAVPPAWPMLGALAATIALFWEQVKDFIGGML